MKTLMIIMIMVLAVSCSSAYVVDCYDGDQLRYREEKQLLIHFHDTTKYERCHIRRIK